MASSAPSPQPVCDSELDALTGEVLPQRAALSLAGAGTGSSTVYYACQTVSSPGSQGLIGALGLGYPPYTTTTCVPAAITSH